MTLHDHIYSNFNISISFKPSITFAGSTGNLGSVRGRSLKAGRIRRLWRQQCLVSSFFLLYYPAGAAAGSCFLLVSSFFFFFFFLLLSSSSSFFWQHIFFTHFPTSYFDQTWSQWPVPWPLLRHKRWWGQGSPWGHWGQKGHLHQKGIKSFRLRSIDTGLMHMQ